MAKIARDEYLRMLDRHRPLWSALHEFVYANGIKSMVEVGCGVGALCEAVDDYTGIDMNSQVLQDNASFYGKGEWIEADWMTLPVRSLEADLFLSASLIEHCESFEPFLKKMRDAETDYDIVTFHKGLRDKETILHQRTDRRFFDNFYSSADVERWLKDNVAGDWRIYTLPMSRRIRARWDSVLVIDWTGEANLEMWEKRNVTR